MLQGERVLKEPQVRLLAGECLLPVEAPAHQGGVAQGVQDAREALGEEGALQVLRVEAHPRDPREDLSRGAPAVLAPLVGAVAMGVVVRDEPVVGLDEFRPACGLLEVPVGHALLDPERRFRVVLPRSALLYLLLAYAQLRVEGPRA